MVCFHTIKKKDAKFKRFQFVCKQICNRTSLHADVPPEKASKHAGYNQIEVFAHVWSRKRAWIQIICSFPVKLLPSWEGVGVEGLIGNLTSKFGPYAYVLVIMVKLIKKILKTLRWLAELGTNSTVANHVHMQYYNITLYPLSSGWMEWYATPCYKFFFYFVDKTKRVMK